MIIKYDKKTGRVIASLPESKFNPPGAVGFVNVFENGKRKYKTRGQIKSLILEGLIPTEYQDPKSGKKVEDLVVVKATEEKITLKNRKTKEFFSGVLVKRFYTKKVNSL